MCAAGYTGFFAEDTSLKRDVLFFHPTVPEDRGLIGGFKQIYKKYTGYPHVSDPDGQIRPFHYIGNPGTLSIMSP